MTLTVCMCKYDSTAVQMQLKKEINVLLKFGHESVFCILFFKASCGH